MKSISVFIFCIILVSTGCHKDKECNPTCGPLQQCNDGVCSCPNGKYLLGNSCIDKCTNCFEGSFDCGCTDQYIFDISKFDESTRQIIMHYVRSGNSPGIGSGDVIKIGENVYRFNIPRSCDLSGKKSTNIEFTVDKSEAFKLKVQARYHILPSNETLGTCETVFTQ
ncbi:MAG TPA: hypothetical protein PKD16_17575 [Saprospiraceae bacterium]|jgi:hypothetical protein|nr:hypothetical protein [Saprospiraceae bacterium]